MNRLMIGIAVLVVAIGIGMLCAWVASFPVGP